MSNKSLPGTSFLMLTGIVLIVLGIVAITSPVFAGKAFMYVIGGLLLLTGIMQFISGWRQKVWYSKLMPIILGVITVICGITVIGHPLLGMEIFTLILAVFFFVEGFWKIIASFSFRPSKGWLAMLASGVLAIVLGLIIWKQWPISGEWAIGILIGVDLVMTGLSMVIISVTMRRIHKALAEKAES
ncbi:MAG: HdeD family acid-resistance protein [Pirellulales bacterium]|nr:HdeD family acid-resistance protein [Pirellulales bacterium]